MHSNIVAHSPDLGPSSHARLSAAARARVARQTAAVHQYEAPAKRDRRDRELAILDGPYGMLAVEREEIRRELAAAGLL